MQEVAGRTPSRDPNSLEFAQLTKLQPGDKVAIVSPSWAGPWVFPDVYELGLRRIREVFGLEPVPFTSVANTSATKEDRARDLIDAFENPDIKGVIASIGGDDQVTYIKNLPSEPFLRNPKPFLGYSDNTHFSHHLWQLGIPSFSGGSVMVEFGQNGQIDPLTEKYLKAALFESGEIELEAAQRFSDEVLDWANPSALQDSRPYRTTDGWLWNGGQSSEGILWGGCLESIDELLRHGIALPSLKQCEGIVLCIETSEEVPPAPYVARILRALGERGILERLQGCIVGRPWAWDREQKQSSQAREAYSKAQQETVEQVVRAYNSAVPLVQNFDYGHTAPQIPLPLGQKIRIDTERQKVFATF